MRKRLLAVSSILMLAALAGCATQTGGYGGGGVGYLGDCEFGDDCYGGPLYTCVLYQPPSAATSRMNVNLAPRGRTPRTVEPRGDGRYSPPPEPASGSSSTTVSLPPSPAVAREPVVVAAPAVDRSSPRVHN